MKATRSVILLMCGLVGVLTGCTNQGLALRDTGSHSGKQIGSNTDRLRNREAYINANSEMQLKTGRATNEQEAEALAAAEWHRLQYRSKLESQ